MTYRARFRLVSQVKHLPGMSMSLWCLWDGLKGSGVGDPPGLEEGTESSHWDLDCLFFYFFCNLLWKPAWDAENSRVLLKQPSFCFNSPSKSLSSAVNG